MKGAHLCCQSWCGKSLKGSQKCENRITRKTLEVMIRMSLGCHVCLKHIDICIRNMKGVNKVEFDEEMSLVTVEGVFSPKALVELIRRETNTPAEIADVHCLDCVKYVDCYIRNMEGKDVRIISHVHSKKHDISQDKKSESVKEVEVMLKVHYDCPNCMDSVDHCIKRMEGVRTVEFDTRTALVTIEGVFNPQVLVSGVETKTGIRADIVDVHCRYCVRYVDRDTRKKEGKHAKILSPHVTQDARCTQGTPKEENGPDVIQNTREEENGPDVIQNTREEENGPDVIQNTREEDNGPGVIPNTGEDSSDEEIKTPNHFFSSRVTPMENMLSDENPEFCCLM